ncbi:MAG: hypothetical protein CM1200mP2_09540 [Planctomycetaceae bacterium]|nr:MAG: hypothetical protein CM1200mP2_09540 [Planctomycetaceae bacterium]
MALPAVRFWQANREEHWTTRWLGPVGRGPHHEVFNPLSAAAWRRIFGRGQPEPLRSAARRGAIETSQRPTFTSPPAALAVNVVRYDRLSALSWLVLAMALVIGIRYRRSNVLRKLDGCIGPGGPGPVGVVDTGPVDPADGSHPRCQLAPAVPPPLPVGSSIARTTGIPRVDVIEDGSLGSTGAIEASQRDWVCCWPGRILAHHRTGTATSNTRTGPTTDGRPPGCPVAGCANGRPRR